MQSVKSSILGHIRIAPSLIKWTLTNNLKAREKYIQPLCTMGGTHSETMARVIVLVKKFDRIDAAKVTETADFQKDLSLDSLDKVELVMAFEQEFSIEIPDDKADKFTCCADVANYIISAVGQKDQ
ncbi:hypothetical protein Ancab_033355 [Ancistrocladus abbreviatus]